MNIPIQAPSVFRSPGPGIVARGIAPSDICATATVQNGQACLNVPVLGTKCIAVPSSFNGQSASLCAHVCTKFGVPIGVCVTATAAGHQLAQHCFGSCSI